MNLPKFGLTHRAIVLAVAVTILAVGLFNLTTMPRREDPQITMRGALVITKWPGASAGRVENLIADPLEEIIGKMSEVDRIISKSIVGKSIIQVFLEDYVKEPEQVWNSMRARVARVQSGLPGDAGQPFFNSDFGDVYEILFALYQVPPADKTSITHPYSFRDLEILAEAIEEDLEIIDTVAKVGIWGRQKEQIYVEVDSADWAKLDITESRLLEIFRARNIVIPGGEFDTATNRYTVKPTGEFSSTDQIADLAINQRDDVVPVRLGELPFFIDRRYEEPVETITRYTDPDRKHAQALVIGISMKTGRNVADMSRAVDRALADLQKSRLPPDIRLVRVNDLPRQVDTRIKDFQVNLLSGALIILILALITMGWRVAVVVAASIPLSMLAALAAVRPLGIELEQFAIASLIISLGLVVDNAIVISDNTVRNMRENTSKLHACMDGAQSLARPLLIATATTIFAFLPMVTIIGDVGEYIGSLPIVVTATLAASYLSAMLVTPIMCYWLLKAPDKKVSTGRFAILSQEYATWLSQTYERTLGYALSHKALVSGLAVVAFGCSLALIPFIGSQFFPNGARDQFFIKVWMPEGTPVAKTSRVVHRIEEDLLAASAVTDKGEGIQRLASVVTFVGTGGPRFMLTQEPEFDYPNYALLLVNTTDPAITPKYASDIRKRLAAGYPEARINVSEFVLGPPVLNPVSFRISGPDHSILRKTARQMIKIFKQTPGATNVNSNWGATTHQIDVEIDTDAANLAGVTNAHVALATRSHLSGLPLGNFREGDYSVPIVLRALREKRENPSDLSGIFVSGQDGKVPLESIARLKLTRQSAVIVRRNRIPTVSVGAQVKEGLLANNVAERMKPGLQKLVAGLPAGYRLAQGGEYEETVKAASQVGVAVVISLILIVLTLTAQYNQIHKPLIVMITIPFALTGVLFGLLVTGWAMGFMATLGVLALIGIVINNAIILIDFIDKRLADGFDLRTAVIEAGQLRMLPILLTTVTTIGGLLPLSLFGGPLWAPMTNGMIFGLIFSAALSLILVPVIYTIFVEKLRMPVATPKSKSK